MPRLYSLLATITGCTLHSSSVPLRPRSWVSATFASPALPAPFRSSQTALSASSGFVKPDTLLRSSGTSGCAPVVHVHPHLSSSEGAKGPSTSTIHPRGHLTAHTQNWSWVESVVTAFAVHGHGLNAQGEQPLSSTGARSVFFTHAEKVRLSGSFDGVAAENLGCAGCWSQVETSQ